MSGCCGNGNDAGRERESAPAATAATGGSCCSAGSGGSPKDSADRARQAGDWLGFAVLAVLAGLSMNFSLGMNLGDAEGETRLWAHGTLLATCVFALLVLGRHLIFNAARELLRGRLTTDLLFLLGIGGSLALSAHSTFSGSGPIYYEVVLILLAIHRLGRLLLGRAQKPLRQALDNLFSQMSRVRMLTCCGREKMIPLEEVEPGDNLRVNTGERVPVDGIILEGEAFILEAQETGVPYPVRKIAGDAVIAGTTLLDAPLRIEASSAGSNRKLDELRASVEEVMRRKSPLLREADKISRVFVPVVCVIALCTAAAWYFIGGWGPAVLFGLSVVVVACPCAFGLALPLLFRLAVGRLMGAGIIPDSPNFLEALARVKTVVFDKTGTLAEAELTLGAMDVREGFDEEELRAILGAVQGRSLHPVARAFHCWTAKAGAVEVRALEELPGKGIRAKVRREGVECSVAVGNRLVLPPESREEVGSDGRLVFIVLNGRHAATARLDEVPLPGAAEALEELAAAGYKVAVLTGDDRLPESLKRPGLEARTCLTSNQKAAFVEEQERSGRSVLFIGDGLNDLEAMNRACAGLAVGKAHELTQYSSRAYWPAPRYRDLPALLSFSRHIVQRGRMVAGVALSYNAFGMTLAALGLIHPVIAALLMLASSFTVTTLASRGRQDHDERQLLQPAAPLPAGP